MPRKKRASVSTSSSLRKKAQQKKLKKDAKFVEDTVGLTQ
jgi:hypothetical protein